MCIKDLSDIAKINVQGGAFDFLLDEPDLYTAADVQKKSR